ncbi:MAG: transglycosylase SLT domain-containing protein [Pseudomonadota bacterium]
MKKNKFIISIIIVAWIIAANPLHAEIYTYIDRQGTLHFTNVPVRSDDRIQIRKISELSSCLSGSSTMNRQYDYQIARAALTYEVPFSLIKAMIKVESDYNPVAVSRAGAKGLMQIMPANIKAYGINNPFDPHENIMVGTQYFKSLFEKFNGNLTLALAAYNAGPACVEKYDSIPPYEETQEYVERVMSYYQQLKKRN